MVVTGQGIAKPGLKVNHTHTVLNAFLDGERGALQPSPLHSDPHLSSGQAELRTDTRGFVPSWGLGSFPDPGPLTLPSSGRADEAQGQCNSEGYQTARRFGGAKHLPILRECGLQAAITSHAGSSTKGAETRGIF